MPGPGSLGGGFVPAASYRMRRSPARPPAPRKARAARNTPLRPGRVLIAAALAASPPAPGSPLPPASLLIRLVPADNPAATSQYTPTVGPAATPSPAASSAPPMPSPSPSAGAAEPPAISTAAAQRVLASYWAANNQANKARSDALLARIEAGTSYQMDAGAYRTGRAAGLASGDTPVTAENPVLWIPRQPAATYPRWFAARVTYTGEGAGGPGLHRAAGRRAMEERPRTVPAPRYRARTVRHHRRQRVRGAGGPRRRWPGRHPRPDRGADRRLPRRRRGRLGNPGNLADMRDEAYFAAHPPPARRPEHRHYPAGWCSPCRLSAAGRSCSTA